MKLLYLNILFFSLLFSLSGCVTETLYEQSTVVNHKETATLTLDLTLPKGVMNGRALKSVDDKSIENVYVLGFRVDDKDETIEYFDFLTSVNNVESTGNNKGKISFTANQADYKQRFVIIANSASFVSSLNPRGQHKEEVLKALTYINPENEWTSSLPMWGESDARIIDDQNATLEVTLTRMVAGIDLSVEESLRSSFTLKEVYLYNAKTRGRIVPDAAHWDADDMKVTQVTLPTDHDPANHPLTKASPCRYEVENPESGIFVAAIYAFEAAAETEDHLLATALVIGGEYNGAMCYYRIDLTGRDENGEAYPLDLLRNHKYAIQITAVQGAGRPDPDEAFRAVSVELNTTIKAWDMAEVGVLLDEQYSLVVSDSLFEMTGDEAAVSLYAATDNPAGIVCRSNSSWIHWSGGDDGDPERILTLSIATNDSGNTRRGTLEIIAGNLTYVLRIVQSADFI